MTRLSELRCSLKALENELVDAETSVVYALEALAAGKVSDAVEILRTQDLRLRVFLDAWRGEGFFSPEEVAERRAIFDGIIASALGAERP
jgi:hypothetical protein